MCIQEEKEKGGRRKEAEKSASDGRTDLFLSLLLILLSETGEREEKGP